MFNQNVRATLACTGVRHDGVGPPIYHSERIVAQHAGRSVVAQEDFCMPLTSWNSRLRLAVAVCALLGVVACAPNSARTPLEPRLAAATDGEREQGRYGTLLRLAASARAAGDQAAAVSLYRQAITETAAVSTPTCSWVKPCGDGSL